MNNLTDHNFEHFSKLTHEEIYKELEQIRQNLCWLDEDICLNKNQRELFYNVKNKVKELLGVKHV